MFRMALKSLFWELIKEIVEVANFYFFSVNPKLSVANKRCQLISSELIFYHSSGFIFLINVFWLWYYECCIMISYFFFKKFVHFWGVLISYLLFYFLYPTTDDLFFSIFKVFKKNMRKSYMFFFTCKQKLVFLFKNLIKIWIRSWSMVR